MVLLRKTDAGEDSRKGITDIVRFLKHLLQHISGKLLLIWDRLPAHCSLCQHSARVEKWRAGSEVAIHWLQVNDLDEEANRWLMNFHAAVGDTVFHLSIDNPAFVSSEEASRWLLLHSNVC